jgi:hypothetical protein
MKRYWLALSLLGLSVISTNLYAHERDDWCRRHPRACEEHRGFNDHDKHRFERWCRHHPQACHEYRNPPRPVVVVPPAPPAVIVRPAPPPVMVVPIPEERKRHHHD